jgi:hypothetical protein
MVRRFHNVINLLGNIKLGQWAFLSPPTRAAGEEISWPKLWHAEVMRSNLQFLETDKEIKV